MKQALGILAYAAFYFVGLPLLAIGYGLLIVGILAPVADWFSRVRGTKS